MKNLAKNSYSTAVEIREFKERETGKTLISADIIVERESQKGIVIGKKGETLKSVGISARARIEDFLQRPVFLELHVKVQEKWRDSEPCCVNSDITIRNN